MARAKNLRITDSKKFTKEFEGPHTHNPCPSGTRDFLSDIHLLYEYLR